jgi:hypothetical protein
MMNSTTKYTLFLSIALLSIAEFSYAQPSKDDVVLCYKSAIKEPLTFYGNPMDTFTLYDGTKWKVSWGGVYEYAPVRYRNVLICTSEGLLVVDKRAISVSRLNQ